MQNEEVGTERTSQRPINIIDSKIRKLMDQKLCLESYRENIYDNSSEKEHLSIEINKDEFKKEFLKEIKTKLDNNRIKTAEINFNKNLEKEYNNKINELNKRISNNVDENYEKIKLKNYYISLIVLFIAFAVLLIASPIKLSAVIPVIPMGIIIYKILKDRKQASGMKLTREESVSKIINEIEVLKQNKENQRKEAEEKENKLNQEIEKDREELILKYQNNISIGYIEEFLSKSYDEINREIELKENRINTSKFRMQTMENNTKEINSKIENLANIEEELMGAEEERDELISLNKSYNIAKECLEKAYTQVKENISPKFTQNLSDIISKISNNRYKNVTITDSEGINVEIDDGRYIPASRLSVGTIDQMYLSLRLSALNEVSDENMPIILDEAFAYFDNDRLTNILRYIQNNFKDNQIIIFTCSDREKIALDNLKIDYNLINLEK